MSGLILVFDMDGVIGPEDGWRPGTPIVINPVVHDILRKAHKHRSQGHISAIFLLTKNTSEEYVKGMDSALSSSIGKARHSDYNFFDDGLYANREYTLKRGNIKYSLTSSKIMDDVKHMIRHVNAKYGKKISTDRLNKRVFFFDDHPEYHPEMQKALGGNLIKIYPPYKPGLGDKTDYSLLPNFLKPAIMLKGVFNKTRRSVYLKKINKRRKTRRLH